MNKQKKWLLIGSLMCLVGGGFHISYGMINDEEEKDKPQEFTQGSNALVLINQEEKEFYLPEDVLKYIMTFLEPKEIGFLWKDQQMFICTH